MLRQTTADTSKHLAFKGVPIDGTLDQYILKMNQTGFKLISTEDGTAILQGDFAGYKECHINVSTLKQKDLVHKIGVVFPNRDTWATLSANYFELKQMLTEKYGTSVEEVEKFDGYAPKDDGMKMHQVQMDRCKYNTKWQADKGEIQLSIEHSELAKCFVKLIYIKKINGAVIKKQAIDDL